MRIKKISILPFILFIFFNHIQATIPEKTGCWKFDDPSNLTKGEDGYKAALTLEGSHSAAAGPENGNGAVQIGPGSHYNLKHFILPNGGGSNVNEYALQYDFMIPGNGIWHSFFQTSMNNENDGDFFINPSGNIGVYDVGYSNYSILPNEWYRLIISVKNGSHYICYLDGNPLLYGNTQSIDGRFSLDSLLLIFADENDEDGPIYCSELAIWDKALNADEAKELSGFGHDILPFLMTRIPYLQGPGQTTMNICWHDTARTGTNVEYGIDSTLGFITQGTCETVSDPYRWHTVKLTGLQPDTRYFYSVKSGIGVSAVYSFKTLPDSTYTGKIRFIILGDTHASDTTMAGKVVRAARTKISELYGPDIENHVNGIFHTGDIVVNGNSPVQYSTEYFHPLSPLSANLPVMLVAGNHEEENPVLYRYLKLDEQSAYPHQPELNEKIWQLRVGNSLFIGMNTNIIDTYGEIEADWLDSTLSETEKNPDVDFVYLFFHHPPFSELWHDVKTFDGGPDYVKNVLFPIIKKYTKVQQLHYGHTHGFERGTILSEKTNGDFRIICGGGGGGPLDPWDETLNRDYNEIHFSFSEYFFQILEIDIASHSYQNSVFSLGTITKPKNSELLDFWYKKKTQPGPDTPVAEDGTITDDYIQFNSSGFSGSDSIMTVQLQVMDSSEDQSVLLDTLVHYRNIYGIDSNLEPIDKNSNINLYRIKINLSLLPGNNPYFFRIRYRDHNLKWSDWSNSCPFKTTGIKNGSILLDNYNLSQNYPNPFHNATTITYRIPERCAVNFRIYDARSMMVAEINEGTKATGTYHIDYKGENLNSGLYFYEMIASNLSIIKKMIKTE